MNRQSLQISARALHSGGFRGKTNIRYIVLSLLLTTIVSSVAKKSSQAIESNQHSTELFNITTLGRIHTIRQGEVAKINPHEQSKITIIINEEDSISVATKETEVSTNGEKTSTQTQAPIYSVDQRTKVIFIDRSNEFGYLAGQIESNKTPEVDSISLPIGERAGSDENGHNYGDDENVNRFKSDRLEHHSGSTNFSVFLISRDKNHIAITIDIEEIDFEHITNFCEYQELRFSIVGEISTQILSKKNGTSNADSGEATIAGGNKNQDEKEDGQIDGDEVDDEESIKMANELASAAPPLPVSEAMAMLLNAPLNRTILHESEQENDFKVIDSTIDYLYEETCKEINQQVDPDHKTLGKTVDERGKNNERTNQGRRQRPNSRPKQQGTRSRTKQSNKRRQQQRASEQEIRQCDQHDFKFRQILAKKLDSYLEWDDFKIVCGRTNQLIIPMRSLKLSIFSDEFAPNSRFKISYRFISDPSVLPASDNGKYFCRNRNVIDLELRCNGFDDCGDGSDESVKICGYPSTTTGSGSRTTSDSDSKPMITRKSTNRFNRNSSLSLHKKQRLTYFNGDVLHCCQSSDWHNAVAQTRANQALNLQSLIGDSMNLFSGPLFAPTVDGRNRAKPRRRVKRIVGGTEAHKGAWPGQVSLQYELLEPLCHFCAGTLVHPQYVLTAGHCITKDGLNRGIKVVLGAHDLRNLSGRQIQVRYVDDAHIYPGVDVKHLGFDWENDMNNDIALLRLNAPVLVTPQVAPACLPPFNTPLAVNTSCRSIGWGQTHGSGSSNLLKHLSLKVVDSSECSRELLDADGRDNVPPGRKRSTLHRGPRFVGDFDSSNIDTYSNQTMVCVNNDQGHGICQGDSGGPLYCDRVMTSGEHCTEIYGVASFIIQYATVGAMCAVENLPGIFGEVSSKTEWISSTIKMFEQSYKLKYSQ